MASQDDSIIPSTADVPDIVASQQSLADFLAPASQAENSIFEYVAELKAIILAANNPPQLNTSLMNRGLGFSAFNSAAVLERWDENFPYRLLVLTTNPNFAVGNQGSGYSQVAEYILPINPQGLTITTPFAIKTTVTSRGMLIEHNGIPIKQITLRGTTGWYLSRPSAPKSGNPSIFGTIFAGTLQAVQGVQNQVSSLVSTISPSATPAAEPIANSDFVNTGYFQYHMLRLFLETYAEIKKLPGSQGLRLALVTDKDSTVYLVEPQTFTSPRDVSSPMEYPYTIQFLAWGTVPSWGFNAAYDQLNAQLSNNVNDLQRAFNSLRQLRRTVSAATNVISAVQSDVNNMLGQVNQAILLIKQIVSIPATIADMPANLRQSLQNNVISQWNSLVRQLNSNGPALTTPGPGAANPPGAPKLTPDILTSINTQVQSMIAENSGSNSFTGPANTTFNPGVLDNINLTDSIDLAQLNTTSAQNQAISNTVDTALNTTNNQVNSLISNLQQLSSALEPSIASLDPLDPSWDLLYNIQDAIGNLYGLMADGSLLTSQNSQQQSTEAAPVATTALAFWQQTADANNIPFTTPIGKFSVPLPFGATLEQLAVLYLKDATRWPEIVALNGLQPPYIDENGFIYAFTENGNGNQFLISSSLNLFVGQIVYISSTTQITTQRKITRIEQLTSSEVLIDVDGIANLEFFTTIDKAQILAYLPYTLNSMRQIYIPSPVTPNQNELNTTPITFIDDDPNLVKFSRIDWLLSPSMDLAVTQNGFFNLAYGKTNLVQAATLKLKTKTGGLILQPNYGLPISVGDSFADTSAKNVVDAINNSFLADERFNAPSNIEVTFGSGATVISLVANVAMGRGNVPMPITVPLSS